MAEAWQRDFEGNVLTAVLLTEALLPGLTRPGGRIVAITSVAAVRGAGSYGAAKAAMHGWVMSLATQLGPDGITVNAVAPGFIPETGFWEGRLTEAVVASRVDVTPVGRPGTPEEVAEAVAYLASEQAGFTTGQILQVNGGMVLGAAEGQAAGRRFHVIARERRWTIHALSLLDTHHHAVVETPLPNLYGRHAARAGWSCRLVERPA